MCGSKDPGVDGVGGGQFLYSWGPVDPRRSHRLEPLEKPMYYPLVGEEASAHSMNIFEYWGPLAALEALPRPFPVVELLAAPQPAESLAAV